MIELETQTLTPNSFKFLSNLIADESGQGTVEYVLLLSVVVVAASQLGKKILSALDSATQIVGGVLEQNLKTGRLSSSAWKQN